MYVYRVESMERFNGEVNYGPWRDETNGSIASSISSDKMRHETHPTPSGDGINVELFDGHKYVCGVQSLELVHHWFGNLYKCKSKTDFRLVKYHVDDEHCRCGDHQVIFDSTKAKIVHILYEFKAGTTNTEYSEYYDWNEVG